MFRLFTFWLLFLCSMAKAADMDPCQRALLENSDFAPQVMRLVSDKLPPSQAVVGYHGVNREEIFELLESGRYSALGDRIDVPAVTESLPPNIALKKDHFPEVKTLRQAVAADPRLYVSSKVAFESAKRYAADEETRAYTLRYFAIPMTPKNMESVFGVHYLNHPEDAYSGEDPNGEMEEVEELKEFLLQVHQVDEEKWRNFRRDFDFFTSAHGGFVIAFKPSVLSKVQAQFGEPGVLYMKLPLEGVSLNDIAAIIPVKSGDRDYLKKVPGS